MLRHSVLTVIRFNTTQTVTARCLIRAMKEVKLGKYLTFKDFCTCSQTYREYESQIDPFPPNLAETLPAIQNLNQLIIEPIIECFGWDRFRLTYGFCAKDLKRYLDQRTPHTDLKNGCVVPELDRNMAHEVNKNGRYYCNRLGAVCDFIVIDTPRNRVVEWILLQSLPFDSIYFYGVDKPIHISYGSRHKRDIRTFTAKGQPTQRGIENWVELAKQV